MARMPARERRALLVDAAITVMAREGVAHTTTRAIVAEAGMQVGVFHYCFRSKEELIGEVARVIGQRSFAAVTDVLPSSSEPAEIIHNATRAFWNDLRTHPLEHQLTYELTQYALRHPGHEQVATTQYAGYYAEMEELLTAVCTHGRCRWRTPVDELGRLTLATIEGITFQWLVSRDDDMTLRLLDRLAAQLCAEVAPPVSGGDGSRLGPPARG